MTKFAIIQDPCVCAADRNHDHWRITEDLKPFVDVVVNIFSISNSSKYVLKIFYCGKNSITLNRNEF